MEQPDDLDQQIILEHSRRPRHRCGCAGATHRAHTENPNCGDEVEVQLRLAADGRIAEATFLGQGCALSQASASLLTVKLRGLSRAEALGRASLVRRLLAGEPVAAADLDTLGDLRALRGARLYPQRVRCALLAWQALEQALGAEPERAT